MLQMLFGSLLPLPATVVAETALYIDVVQAKRLRT
ncbi:Uncharacterised protein [Escherichia coli]|nr:Uncharacterised protein [Escherichia coli]CAD5646218.1 Uncharacterised protein [Escherichia coli]